MSAPHLRFAPDESNPSAPSVVDRLKGACKSLVHKIVYKTVTPQERAERQAWKLAVHRRRMEVHAKYGKAA